MLSFGLHTQFDWKGNEVSLGADLVVIGSPMAALRGMLAFLAVNSTYRGPASPGSAAGLAFGMAVPRDRGDEGIGLSHSRRR